MTRWWRSSVEVWHPTEGRVIALPLWLAVLAAFLIGALTVIGIQGAFYRFLAWW